MTQARDVAKNFINWQKSAYGYPNTDYQEHLAVEELELQILRLIEERERPARQPLDFGVQVGPGRKD